MWGASSRRSTEEDHARRYHEELDSIGDGLVEMAGSSGRDGHATTAMLDADLTLADRHRRGREGRRPPGELEPRGLPCWPGSSRSPPICGIVVTSRMSADLERSGDLAQHVAKVARLRFPDHAVPHDLHATLLEMGSSPSG